MIKSPRAYQTRPKFVAHTGSIFDAIHHRSLEHRGYVQEYQAVAGQRGAADVERPMAGACGGDKSVAVFGGVGVIYPVWLSEKQHPDHAVVFRQDPSELSGCVGRIAKSAVAETNYIMVGNHTVPARIIEFFIEAAAAAA